MTPRNAAEAVDFIRAREAQARQARRQAKHFRSLSQLENKRASQLEADAARARQAFQFTPTADVLLDAISPGSSVQPLLIGGGA